MIRHCPDQTKFTSFGFENTTRKCHTHKTKTRRRPCFPYISHGETQGAVLVLQDARITNGAHDLVYDASMRLLPGERRGLVGRNGAGKSTLLKCVAGVREVDEGEVRLSRSAQISYLEQTAVSGSTKTVYEEVCSRMTNLMMVRQQMECAQEDMARGVAGGEERFDKAAERFKTMDGWRAEKEISKILIGLGKLVYFIPFISLVRGLYETLIFRHS